MLKKVLISIEEFCDKKIKNETIMVAVITVCITMAGILTNVNAPIAGKANILEASKKEEIVQYVLLNQKKYKITLEEMN